MDILRAVAQDQIRTDLPDFKAGDRIVVHYRIIEGKKERIQLFEGNVLQRRNNGIAETMTVRKISNGVGVERIFIINSPKIAKIDVLRRGRVRRARIFYLRDAVGKKARIKEQRRK